MGKGSTETIRQDRQDAAYGGARIVQLRQWAMRQMVDGKPDRLALIQRKSRTDLVLHGENNIGGRFDLPGRGGRHLPYRTGTVFVARHDAVRHPEQRGIRPGYSRFLDRDRTDTDGADAAAACLRRQRKAQLDKRVLDAGAAVDQLPPTDERSRPATDRACGNRIAP